MQNNKRTNQIIYSIIAFFISTYCFNSHCSDNPIQNSLIEAYKKNHNGKDITPIEIIKNDHDIFFDHWEKLNQNDNGTNKETIDKFFIGILNSSLKVLKFATALHVCYNNIFIKHIPKLDSNHFYNLMSLQERCSKRPLFYAYLEQLSHKPSNELKLTAIKNIFKKIEDSPNGKTNVYYMLTWKDFSHKDLQPLPCFIDQFNLEAIKFFVSKIKEYCDYNNIKKVFKRMSRLEDGIIHRILIKKNTPSQDKIKILESIKDLLKPLSKDFETLKDIAHVKFKNKDIFTTAIKLNNAEILYHLCDIFKDLLSKQVQKIFNKTNNNTNNKANFDTIKEILEKDKNIEKTKKETIYQFLKTLDEQAFYETFPACKNETKEEYKNIHATSNIVLTKNVTISDKIRSWLPTASSTLAAITTEFFADKSQKRYVIQHNQKPIIGINSLTAAFFANISSRMFNYVTNTPKIKTNKILNISSMTSNIALSTLIGFYATKKMSIQRKAFSNFPNKKVKRFRA